MRVWSCAMKSQWRTKKIEPSTIGKDQGIETRCDIFLDRLNTTKDSLPTGQEFQSLSNSSQATSNFSETL